jgi:hypothetical protein
MSLCHDLIPFLIIAYAAAERPPAGRKQTIISTLSADQVTNFTSFVKPLVVEDLALPETFSIACTGR